MNNAALSAAIVIMCIVAPMGVAYLYPSDSSDVTDYTVAKTTDISSSLYNSEIPAYGYYSGTINNMFQINSDGFLAEPVKTTTTIGEFPALDKVSDARTISVSTLGNDGDELTYYDFLKYTDSSVFMTVFNVDVIYKVSASTSYVYHAVLIYPSSNQMYVCNNNEIVNATSSTLTLFTLLMSDTISIDEYSQRTEGGKPLYADLSGGIQISHDGSSIWCNTFRNSKVTVLVPLQNEYHKDQIRFGAGPDSNPSVSHIYIVYVTVSALGDIFLQESTASQGLVNFGSASVYDHLLFEYEYDEGHVANVTITGISGLSRLNGDYSTLKGNSVTFTDTESPGPLKTIDFSYAGGIPAYYIASAYVNSGTTKVMSDATVTPSDYYPDSNWTVRLGSTAIYGDVVTFHTRNGESLPASVENGKISLTGLSEFSNISLLGMTVENRTNTGGGYTTMINGVALPDRYAGLTSIEFSGVWSMNVYLSDLDATTHKEYVWTAGGFGLDMKGFALAGLATAVLSFIGVGLWGQRSGQKVILAMLTATMCGVVYLLML